MNNIAPQSPVMRRLTLQDNPAIARVIRQVSAEYGLTADKGYTVADPNLDELYQVYSQPGHAYWVVEYEGEVVGGIVVARYGQNALDVIHNVKQTIGEISAGLPKGVLNVVLGPGGEIVAHSEYDERTGDWALFAGAGGARSLCRRQARDFLQSGRAQGPRAFAAPREGRRFPDRIRRSRSRHRWRRDSGQRPQPRPLRPAQTDRLAGARRGRGCQESQGTGKK